MNKETRVKSAINQVCDHFLGDQLVDILKTFDIDYDSFSPDSADDENFKLVVCALENYLRQIIWKHGD